MPAGDEAAVVWIPSPAQGALRQCEVLSDVVLHHVQPASIGSGTLVFDELPLPLSIVITQDCDLDWDWKDRAGLVPNATKALPSVLLLELKEAQPQYDEDKNLRASWKRVQQNKEDRYHFLQKALSQEDASRLGLPELVADFKRYHAIPTGELYDSIQRARCTRRCVLNHPYLQHLTQRFGSFMGRVALPLDHQSEPSSPR